jgi:lysyl-tRNA synthetase class 2
LLQRGPAERLTYREAFQRFANVDPLLASEEQLATCLRSVGQAAAVPNELDRDLLLDLLLTTTIEPQLGVDRPTILCDYPASQSALAQVRHEDAPVAERFELYVDGIELANGYHELLDPQVLRTRNATNNSLRRDDGKYTLPESSRLLDAMTHGLPPCAGCALGFDRLVMVAAGATSIQEVMTFPHDRA